MPDGIVDLRIRDVDPDLMKQLKRMALDKDLSLRALVLKILTEAAKRPAK